MKKSFLLTMGFSVALVLAACGSDDDGGTQHELSSGTYTISNASVDQDTCGFGSAPGDYDGATFNATVSDAAFDIDFDGDGTTDLSLTRSGNNLSASSSDEADLNTDFGVDCVLQIDIAYSGGATATDTVSLTETIDIDRISGTECDQAVDETPCVHEVSFTAAADSSS